MSVFPAVVASAALSAGIFVSAESTTFFDAGEEREISSSAAAANRRVSLSGSVPGTGGWPSATLIAQRAETLDEDRQSGIEIVGHSPKGPGRRGPGKVIFALHCERNACAALLASGPIMPSESAGVKP